MPQLMVLGVRDADEGQPGLQENGTPHAVDKTDNQYGAQFGYYMAAYQIPPAGTEAARRRYVHALLK